MVLYGRTTYYFVMDGEQRTCPSLQRVWKVLSFATDKFKDVTDALCLCPPCPCCWSTSQRLPEPYRAHSYLPIHHHCNPNCNPHVFHAVSTLSGELRRRNQNAEVTPRSLTQDSQWHLYWSKMMINYGQFLLLLLLFPLLTTFIISPGTFWFGIWHPFFRLPALLSPFT